MFCCTIGLKDCPFYENPTFFLKNSGKNLRISKNSSTFALEKLIKQYKTMKKIYLSLPITVHEDTYEERLQGLVEVAEGFARYKKLEDADFCEYEIITPKDVAYGVEDRMKNPKYTDYLLACLEAIVDCDVVILGDGWLRSKGCRIEMHFATNLGIYVTEEAIINGLGWQA